jgi:hypothetical protein
MASRVLFVLLTQFLLGITIVYADDSASLEDVSELLWKYEEEYIQAHRDADHEKVLSFWDESFLGWPSRLDAVTGKDGGEDYLSKFFAEPDERDFRIERQGVRVIGDIAILHYRIYVGEDTGRITHTWIQRDSRWYMLGGMDSPDLSR